MSIDPDWFDQEFTPRSLKCYSGLLHPIVEERGIPQVTATHQRLEALLTIRTNELKAAKIRTQLILNACVDPLAVVDTHGRFTFINFAACHLLGYQAETLIGHYARDIFHCSYPDGKPYSVAECPITATLRHHVESHADHATFQHANGQALAVTYAIQPMLDGGKVVGAVINFWDISEHSAIAPEQQPWHEPLTYLSHEVRTPLNAMLGLAKLGAHEAEGNNTRETFLNIIEAGQALLDIVNSVLDFAKIDAGKLHLDPIPFDPMEVIDRAIALTAPQASAKGLILQIEKHQNLPAICIGDNLRLLQILVNLLSNAVKFTSRGSVTLWAGWEEEILLLRITDTGIGMTTEQQNRLFIPFEQADNTTHRHFGGTGLGLVITKKLLDLMGGEIQVRSSPGQGSTFEVKIITPSYSIDG